MDEPIVDATKLPVASEDRIDAWAREDDSAWTEQDFQAARWAYPAPSAAVLRSTRLRLGLTERQFAARFGFSAEEIRGYEQGKIPLGHAATLLRIVVADPDAAHLALQTGPEA